MVVLVVAYLVRPHVTDEVTRRYFFPALLVRMAGALAVGFIYQFYYGGGDTFAFHTHGSRIIWEALWEDPLAAIKLFFSNGDFDPDFYKYAAKIWYFRDPQSFMVIRVAAILDLFTFSSYSATAILFSVIGFSGAWALFVTFYRLYPDMHKWLAVACLFIPTVFFWGSGIFKDTLTLTALEWATFGVSGLMNGKRYFLNGVLVVAMLWIVYGIKKYILLCFLPAVLLWIFLSNLAKIRSFIARMLLIPIMLVIAAMLGYYAIVQVGADDPRYSISKLAETARITAYDIRYGWGARTGEGSGYTLGELDGTFSSMIRLAPQAVVVSLFRPYLWEVNNPFMMLSALEGLLLMALTIVVLKKSIGRFWSSILKPRVLFCAIFSLVFAFAVGVSTYNFGTLSRYKIPLLPFYGVALAMLFHYSKRDKKLDELELSEK